MASIIGRMDRQKQKRGISMADTGAMDLVGAGQSELEEYTALLMEKERIRKTGHDFQLTYDRMFGPLIVEEFQAQVEAIKQKIELSLYIQVMNRGEQPDPEEIEKDLDARMENWRRRMKLLVEYHETIAGLPELPVEYVLAAGRLYRRLAKRIHPDLHPEYADDPVARELWERLCMAYKGNNIPEMEELEVLIARLDPSHPLSPDRIPDLAEKIRRLKKEIQGMMSRDPFLYGVWIGDPEQVREKQEEYRRLIQGWKESRKQFAKKLETLLLERRNPGCPMN
ncbi:J domain-containing protein [Faecalibaculum rodentium]|uniref:J domain-containing protein n=2 Tax=Faecalibaculum rodentium TaxID=1702221 RepID=UPI0023F28E6D|nr:J domain-containing protein [Faecalibaculum rodentium]